MAYSQKLKSDVKCIVNEIVRKWDSTEIYIPFSADLAIEYMLYFMEGKKIFSCDDNPLANLMGTFYSGKKIHVALKQELEKEYDWLLPYMKSDTDKLATAMIVHSMAMYVKDEGKHPYYERMAEAYRKQWSDLHKTTKAKIEKRRQFLEEYHVGNPLEWLQNAPENIGVVLHADAPINRKRALRSSRNLTKIFDISTEPSFKYSDDLLADVAVETMNKREWAIVSPDMILGDGMDELIVGKIKSTNRAYTSYVYANSDQRRIVTPRQGIGRAKYTCLGLGDEVGNEMTIAVLSSKMFRMLRSKYMNEGIRPGSASLSVGVFVDGLLVGVFAFSVNEFVTHDKNVETPVIYMLSDFPVEPTDYGRLAKLVLYAALSRESQLLVERLTRRRVRTVNTTALSENPVSMKYRGLFKLYNREKFDVTKESWAKELDRSNAYYDRPYELQYAAPIGQWTLQEGLELWKQRYGQKGGKKEGD